MKKTDKQLEEYKTGWQRCQADFENYKKRVESDKASWTTQAKIDVFAQILPALDNLALASTHAPKEPNQWETGIIHISKQLAQTIEELGITRIAPGIGEKFDPNVHEAVAVVEDKKVGSSNIVTCQSSGYILDGQLIRAAKVTVAK